MPRPRPYRRLLEVLASGRFSPGQASVLEGLRRAILDGAAPPGSTIPVNEVATARQVSPIPVREALKTLVAEGLVDHRPNGGYRVAQLTLTELREIYFTRGVLERAALARAVALATDDDVSRARAEHQSLLRASEFGDDRAFALHSRLLHRALVAPCGMHRLLNMFEATWNLTEPFRIMRSASAADQEQLHVDHEKMISATERRDAEELIAVAAAHHDRLESVIVSVAAELHVLHEEPRGHERG